MAENLNDKLIAAVRKALPEEVNMAHELMDILLIGKESIYRRLRGEVFFTFEEIARISKKLEISVDSIVGLNNSEKAIFDLNLLDPTSKIENYAEKLEFYIRLFRQMRKDPHSKVRYALNTLPYAFYLAYNNLAKFKYYRWLYQTSSPMTLISYKDLVIPPQIEELQRAFAAESKYINKTLVILDRNVFTSMRFEVEYFYNLGLISKEDVLLLKEEILDMLDLFEYNTLTGRFKTGQEVEIYLSNADIESTYCHYEFGEHQFAHLRVFGINGIDTRIPKVCERQKEWIDSMKRYSTLITQSGEAHRVGYFKLQRAEMNKILAE